MNLSFNPVALLRSGAAIDSPKSTLIQVVFSAGYEDGLLGWEVAVALCELGGGVSDISEREGVETLELGGGGADLCEWTPGQDC